MKLIYNIPVTIVFVKSRGSYMKRFQLLALLDHENRDYILRFSLSDGTSKSFLPAHFTICSPSELVGADLVYIIVVDASTSSPNPHALKKGLGEYMVKKSYKHRSFK